VTEDVHAERRERAAARLRETGADGLVCFPSRNLQYLTGFAEEPGERHLLLVVPAADRSSDTPDGGDQTAAEPTLLVPALLVPALYETQVKEETTVGAVRTWADGDDPTAAVQDLLGDLGLSEGRLLVDDTMWATFTQDLRAAAPDAEWGLASEALADLRVRKDEAELDAMRAAAGGRRRDGPGPPRSRRGRGRDDRTRPHRLDRGPTGRPRRRGNLLRDDRRVGAERGEAPPRLWRPRIRAGEPVVLDFGTRVDGYPSDQTRTLVFDGEPPAEYERVHETVRAAQAAAVEAVEPGVAAEAIDRAARDVIEDAGYGDAFFHRTGHGVGLDVHEEPYIVAGNDRELEPGWCSRWSRGSTSTGGSAVGSRTSSSSPRTGVSG